MGGTCCSASDGKSLHDLSFNRFESQAAEKTQFDVDFQATQYERVTVKTFRRQADTYILSAKRGPWLLAN